MIASSLKEGQEQQDGADEIVDLLLNKGADVNIKSESHPFFFLGGGVWGGGLREERKKVELGRKIRCHRWRVGREGRGERKHCMRQVFDL